MKNALFWLNVFLTIALTSSCAHAMGKKRYTCNYPAVPERPQYEMCIAGPDGSAGCYDERQSKEPFTRPSIVNYVCMPAQDWQGQDEWIKYILENAKK